MKSYEVIVPFVGYCSVEIAAETEKEAITEALKKVTIENAESIEFPITNSDELEAYELEAYELKSIEKRGEKESGNKLF
jgi:hypothetical protein